MKGMHGMGKDFLSNPRKHLNLAFEVLAFGFFFIPFISFIPVTSCPCVHKRQTLKKVSPKGTLFPEDPEFDILVPPPLDDKSRKLHETA